jgi:hypothetical protein
MLRFRTLVNEKIMEDIEKLYYEIGTAYLNEKKGSW